MTNKRFVASNGFEGIVDEDGDLELNELGWLSEFIHGDRYITAAAEYFQHKRDEELGRWRDPENQNMVVYPWRHGHVSVLDETTGIRSGWDREEALKDWNEPPKGFATARAYFAAHPPEPKPWEEAEAGEVWVITHEGVEGPAIVSDDEHFESPDYVSGIYNKAITAGYRIWPTKED